jgi:TonB family protein
MKKYFLQANGSHAGPYSAEELRMLNVTSITPVWYEGLAAWKNAGEIPELNFLFSPAAYAHYPNPHITPHRSSALSRTQIVLLITVVAVVMGGGIGFLVYKKVQKNKMEFEQAMEDKRDKEEEEMEDAFPPSSYDYDSDAIMELSEAPEAAPEVVVEQVAETQPEFPGGSAALNKFIRDNIHYPGSAKLLMIQGTVYVRFTVDKDGNVIDPVIVGSVDPALDQEALRMIKKMPKWKPGTMNGVRVKTQMTQPVRFVL